MLIFLLYLLLLETLHKITLWNKKADIIYVKTEHKQHRKVLPEVCPGVNAMGHFTFMNALSFLKHTVFVRLVFGLTLIIH